MSDANQPAQPIASAAFDPHEVEVWIFDLDNTLYPASCNLFDQVDARMSAFIQEILSLEPLEARRVQKQYFREHGTTLRGLMDRHEVDPAAFLDYVHDIDFSVIPQSPGLEAVLARLSGRKLVFTNATVPYSRQVLGRLGITHHMEAIFDIVAADYRPKPEPESYRQLVAEHGIDPRRAVLVEDIARNLAPAAALGMTTVWIPNDTDWSRDGAEDGHVHHVAEDLAAWLEDLLGAPA
ncbi:MAG: pyrimidine 5'-nucleotidase [Kiloniellales bacterium]|nr:pyrimidine 5'-nucleotidase [Kiloniellales bacterium]